MAMRLLARLDRNILEPVLIGQYGVAKPEFRAMRLLKEGGFGGCIRVFLLSLVSAL